MTNRTQPQPTPTPTSTPTPSDDNQDIQHQWRGVALDSRDDELPTEITQALRGRSRRLLRSLLHPHKRPLIIASGLLLLQNAAAMAGPYLVSVGIDKGITPIADNNDPTILIVVTVAFVLAAIIEYLAKRSFL